ncbi:MAG: HlyC/CorC family transporter [Chloroflexi bacterium]|nr:MAG: HlyC/CorC family transporter [Chloroflexota bacterium]
MFAPILTLITIGLIIFVNAFYVAGEFSAVSARKTRVQQMADSGNRLAKILLPIVEDGPKLDQYVAASQVGITVSSLVLGAYGQNTIAAAIAPYLLRLGLESITEPVATTIAATGVLLGLSIFQIVMGELVPKSITLQYPERVAQLTVVPMKWSLALFRPFIWLFNGSANLLLRLVGFSNLSEREHVHSPREIELLVSESYEGGLLDEEARQMLRNALHLRELTARHVMVPRVRIVAAPAASTVSQLIDLACREGYSRIPVYRDSIDNITGFVHIKDLFRLHLHNQQDPTPIIRPVLYKPEGVSAAELWQEMSLQRYYIAIVMDEFGGTAGLVTVEDLVEEIFGEVQDEFDEELPLATTDQAGRLHLRADLLVADVNEYLHLNLPETETDTLGGLVFSHLGRLPKPGDEVTLGDPPVTIRVEAMEGRSISEVSLQIPTDLPDTNRLGEWEITSYD